jgi:hypothetical protein
MRSWRNAVIRQAISCDICGAEKKQTNHWFVANEHGGEIRVSGWNSRNRMRPGSKHLCGQTCLHKLVDDFMARDVAARMQRGIVDEVDLDEQTAGTDASLTSSAAYSAADIEMESSARLITPLAPAMPKRIGLQSATSSVEHTAPMPLKSGADLVAMPAKLRAEATAAQLEEVPGFRSRNWRAEAWDREREREMRAAERRPDIAARRRSSSS